MALTPGLALTLSCSGAGLPATASASSPPSWLLVACSLHQGTHHFSSTSPSLTPSSSFSPALKAFIIVQELTFAVRWSRLNAHAWSSHQSWESSINICTYVTNIAWERASDLLTVTQLGSSWVELTWSSSAWPWSLCSFHTQWQAGPSGAWALPCSSWVSFQVARPLIAPRQISYLVFLSHSSEFHFILICLYTLTFIKPSL